MSVFDETPAPPSAPNRTPLVVGALVVLTAATGGWYLTRPPKDAPAPAPAATTPSKPVTAPPAKKAAPAAAAAVSADDAPRTPPRSAPEPDAPAAPPAGRADAATLTVESDVPGASVFVDREFVGTAPVTLKDLTPGSKRINLSAEGYEGVQRAVDVAAGESTVTLRFKEVRLNATVGVAHKHGVGGCDGTLRATVDGLSYETSNKGDAFSLPYAQVESFEVNYLDKNLRVKQKGGKTWNFTDKAAENADKLFVFHRDVTAAREKLAKGYTAAR